MPNLKFSPKAPKLVEPALILNFKYNRVCNSTLKALLFIYRIEF